MENELFLGITGNELLNLVFKAMIILVPIIWAIVKTKLKLDEKTTQKIEQIAEKAINEVYLEYVRDKKVDGKKLTKEEILEAQDKAWQKSVDLATKNGINMLDYIQKSYFPVVIDKLIAKMKGK